MLCEGTNLGHFGEATQLVENLLLHEEKVGVASAPSSFSTRRLLGWGHIESHSRHNELSGFLSS